MTWTPIVGKSFDKDTFQDYVVSLQLADAGWKPQFVVLHNTSSPTLKQYEHNLERGITDEKWLHNLASFYRGKGWNAGPHLFITPKNILTFTPLTHRGTHTPSWNHNAWGVEMVGEYQIEPFVDPLKDLAAFALAVLFFEADLSPLPYALGKRGLHFHKEDKRSTHDTCPGKHVIKSEMISLVQDYMVSFNGGDHEGIPQNDEEATPPTPTS